MLPLAVRTQQLDRIKRIGVLIPYAKDDPEVLLRITALREGLLKLGWTEGRNIRLEHRWSASEPIRTERAKVAFPPETPAGRTP
jgi:hypothetical protein